MASPTDWNTQLAGLAAHASSATRIRHQRVMPDHVVKLGELVGVMYRTTRAPFHEPRTFVHFMATLPLLVSNLEGNQLYVVGGDYRVTARGIEG